MKQKAIILCKNEWVDKNMKIIGFPNYPTFIFKKLLNRERKEKIKWGKVINPVFKKGSYNIKISKSVIPNVQKSFFIVNNGIIYIYFLEEGFGT